MFNDQSSTDNDEDDLNKQTMSIKSLKLLPNKNNQYR